MTMKPKLRLIILPGSSRPGSKGYDAAYAGIKSEALRRQFDFKLATYPGQAGAGSGLLDYDAALTNVLDLCRTFRPNWIIGRSFGCLIAAGSLASVESWVDGCSGAVLWGPCLGRTIQRLWPTVADRKAEIDGYARYGTMLSPDFFETLPAIEEMIRGARSNLRICAGSFDKYCACTDLETLAREHGNSQPRFAREIAFLDGLPHIVVPEETPEEALSAYYSCLFDDIDRAKTRCFLSKHWP